MAQPKQSPKSQKKKKKKKYQHNHAQIKKNKGQTQKDEKIVQHILSNDLLSRKITKIYTNYKQDDVSEIQRCYGI